MQILLITTLLSILISAASAISCYSCESVYEPKCAEDFDIENYFKIDCSRISPPRYLENDLAHKNATGCMKRIYKVPVHVFRNRQERFMPYFTNNADNTFVFCNDVHGLMHEMSIEYQAADWRIFIDSSKSSLKAVLPFFNNTKPPIPLAYAIHMKETYESFDLILKSIKYVEHGWRVCADLKVISLLSGMKSGWPKHACFLCTWNTRFEGNQYNRTDWPLRQNRLVGVDSIVKEELVPTEKILLPPLHIKLGVVKNFIKSLQTDSCAVQFLRATFPHISFAKIKEEHGVQKIQRSCFFGEVNETVGCRLDPTILAMNMSCIVCNDENYCNMATVNAPTTQILLFVLIGGSYVWLAIVRKFTQTLNIKIN